MEGKNIYLSVFTEFLGLLSFCLLKLTKKIDLQVMRVTMMFRMMFRILFGPFFFLIIIVNFETNKVDRHIDRLE